jgi:hypothetical protein
MKMTSAGARRHQWMTVALLTVVAAAAAGLFGISTASATGSGAGYTSVDESVDGTGHCRNGNPNVNCNIYDGEQFVWLNGGPIGSALGDGTYFFAVIAPSGQADPNDGSLDLLSTDPYANRTFTVSDGSVTYNGTHDLDGNKIRLMPYDNTPNAGGVYIVAICSLGGGGAQPVAPSSCKYDAFKIQAGQVAPADPLTITKDANGSDTNTFTWDISKDVDHTLVNSSSAGVTFNYTVNVTHDPGTISGVTVSGTISVFNPNVDGSNTVPVDIDAVTDQLSDGTVCSVTNGGAQTLTQFQTDFAYSCDLSALPQGQLDNKASVSWSEQFLSNGALLSAGSADFTFQNISFDPTTVDDCVAVSDSQAGSLGGVCVGDPNPTTFNYSKTYTDPAGTCTKHDNTAAFTTNDTGTTDWASQSATHCVGANLSVSKTANAAFKRTYNWSISKDVDKTRVEQIGGTATFNYSVTAAETGFTDSNWVVTGTITVANPNDWEDVPVTISDSINNGGNCTIDGLGASQTVPADGFVTATYTCTYSSAPSPIAGTNTGRADWDASAASTPDAFATGTAGASFGAPTSTVNKTITVTDTFNGGSPTTLGTLTATDTTPYTTKTYTYSRTVAVPTFNCVSYPNTTKIVETNQTANRLATVCGPARTGALTMGFWQNKNGQGIITGGASTGGVCNSATWLRTYAPFQDLSATATCTQVATYVTNVIKAANASGAAMNAMLKAQMLATALDVYFSDPALGGNKIGAPAPIGGVKIDLTKICKMADSSNGGSCTNAYQNVSSAFGGATSLTVSQILAYAASQSNAGGSTWYGQVKATQEMAKNTFDAINNQVAFPGP